MDNEPEQELPRFQEDEKELLEWLKWEQMIFPNSTMIEDNGSSNRPQIPLFAFPRAIIDFGRTLEEKRGGYVLARLLARFVEHHAAIDSPNNWDASRISFFEYGGLDLTEFLARENEGPIPNDKMCVEELLEACCSLLQIGSLEMLDSRLMECRLDYSYILSASREIEKQRKKQMAWRNN